MGLRGTNQEWGRPYNRRIVLEAIRLDGPTTRGRIAERVGLTVQTVSTIIRELEDLGLVLSVRAEPKGRGYPPSALRINPDGGFAIGVHVTPLGIDAGLVNLSGDVIATTRRAAQNVSPDEGFCLIAECARELRHHRPEGRLLGVGLALPGPFDVDSMSFVGPTTLSGWAGVPLQERLQAATGLPAFIEVDSAASAHGERLYGRGAEFAQFYYLYFGVGLGGAMVVDGTVQRGAWGNAGEVGHIPVVAGGEACPCGNAGCLERYVSLEAYLRRPNGMPLASWLNGVAPLFRSAVTTIENLYDPATIILGGLAPLELISGLAEIAGALPNSVSARRERTVPRLVVSDGGTNTVLRGAAALAVAGVLSPRLDNRAGPLAASTDILKELAA